MVVMTIVVLTASHNASPIASIIS